MALSAYFAKLLFAELSSSQVLWLRFSGYVVMMVIPTVLLCGREVWRPYRPDLQVIRGLLAIGVAYTFLLALERMDLAETMVIFYVYPILAYFLGILFLGERSTLLNWGAAAAGFCGVLFIIRPDVGGVNAGAGFALLAAILVSVRMALYRQDLGKVSPLVAAFWERCIGMVALSIVVPFNWATISAEMAIPVLGLILTSIVAQVTLVYAISLASLGALAPLVYWEVIFALMLDITLLGASFGMATLIGIFIIVAAGITMSLGGADNRG